VYRIHHLSFGDNNKPAYNVPAQFFQIGFPYVIAAAARGHRTMQSSYDVVIIGAGMAGIAAAEALSRHGAGRIALVDSGPPLALTSDKSTECYRNFWPGPDEAMLAFMNDSIAELTEHAASSGDRFLMQQRGYLFATAQRSEVEQLERQAEQVEDFGGGRLRRHNGNSTIAYPASPATGTDPTLDGADLITDPIMIREHFPYLSNTTVGVLHARRCGAVSAQQLGMYLLETGRDAGVEWVAGEFIGIDTAAGSLSQVHIATAQGTITLQSPSLVLAPGPHLKASALAVGIELPVRVEKHVKISVPDPLGVIPRDAPLIIWNDAIDLPWTEDEREALAASPETERLLQTFPAGVHGRPVGAGDQVLMYWTYDCETLDKPEFPIEPDPFLPEVTLRGMAEMVPGLQRYLDPMPRPYADGGYYTKAPDNRPLIGPLQIPGTFVCGAFSGYGIMASPAAGKLIAAIMLGKAQPTYSSAFDPNRFQDPAYIEKITGLSTSGQL